MPLVILVSVGFLVMSALQAVVNYTVVSEMQGPEFASWYLVNVAVLVVLAAGVAFRKRAARWMVVLVAGIGVSGGAGLLFEVVPGEAAVWIVTGFSLAPGYVQTFLHVTTAVLLLLPPSARWFRAAAVPKLARGAKHPLA